MRQSGAVSPRGAVLLLVILLDGALDLFAQRLLLQGLGRRELLRGGFFAFHVQLLAKPPAEFIGQACEVVWEGKPSGPHFTHGAQQAGPAAH